MARFTQKVNYEAMERKHSRHWQISPETLVGRMSSLFPNHEPGADSSQVKAKLSI